MIRPDHNQTPPGDEVDPDIDPGAEAPEGHPPGDGPEEHGKAAGTTAQTQGDENIATLLNQISELKSQVLRANADYQNLSRRSSREVRDAGDQAKFEMAKGLVTVLDHFDRALELDPNKASLDTLLKGMQMVRDEFLKTLERSGIQRLDAQPGEEFDPRRHEALMRQAAPDIAPNHVAAQLQPGYTFGDRVVRPAKVSVADENR
jgi:molecular chaperone GrpE